MKGRSADNPGTAASAGSRSANCRGCRMSSRSVLRGRKRPAASNLSKLVLSPREEAHRLLKETLQEGVSRLGPLPELLRAHRHRVDFPP